MCKHYLDNEQFLFTEEEFDGAGSRDKLPIKCLNCGETFYKSKNKIQCDIKENQQNYFCSKKCNVDYRNKNTTSQIVKCSQCGKECIKRNSYIKKSKSGNNFCSSSCAATYNNTHKTSGYRRSKLELHLQNILEEKYLNLNIEYNDRKTLDGLELDIYIPSLNLAFELNGIFHYQPVFGKSDKEKDSNFQNILNKDAKKHQLCQEKNINLCIIDTSSQKYFTIKSSQKFVDAVCFIIDKRIEQLQQQGIEINDVKIVKDPNVITPYVRKYKTEPCKYCGILKGEGDHSLCRWLPTLRKFGFNDNVIGTDQFQNEVDRIIELVYLEHKVLSFPQIAKKYGFNSYNISRFLKKFIIKLISH